MGGDAGEDEEDEMYDPETQSQPRLVKKQQGRSSLQDEGQEDICDNFDPSQMIDERITLLGAYIEIIVTRYGVANSDHHRLPPPEPS